MTGCGGEIFCIVAVDVNVSCTSSTVIQYDRMKRISYSMLVKDRIARIFLFYDGHGRISYSVTWMYASWRIFRFHGDTWSDHGDFLFYAEDRSILARIFLFYDGHGERTRPRDFLSTSWSFSHIYNTVTHVSWNFLFYDNRRIRSRRGKVFFPSLTRRECTRNSRGDFIFYCDRRERTRIPSSNDYVDARAT